MRCDGSEITLGFIYKAEAVMLCNMFCVFVQLSVSHSNLSAGRGEYVPTTEELLGSETHLQMH